MALFDVEEFRRWKREYEIVAQREITGEQQRVAEKNEVTASKKTKKLNNRKYSQFDKRKLFCNKIKELLQNVPDERLENVFNAVKTLIEQHSE